MVPRYTLRTKSNESPFQHRNLQLSLTRLGNLEIALKSYTEIIKSVTYAGSRQEICHKAQWMVTLVPRVPKTAHGGLVVTTRGKVDTMTPTIKCNTYWVVMHTTVL